MFAMYPSHDKRRGVANVPKNVKGESREGHLWKGRL